MTLLTGFWPADPARLLSVLEKLAPERPDIFLTPDATGLPATCVAGLWPEAELRLQPGDGAERLKGFCFGGSAPGPLSEAPRAHIPGPALGFLSYHAGFSGLGLPIPPGPPGAFPLGVFRKYRVVLMQDRLNNRVRVLARDPSALAEAVSLLNHAAASPPMAAAAPTFPGPLDASLDATAYRQAVQQAREAILDGHVYQLNLSIRFETGWPDGLDPAQVFWGLGQRHPAHFYALYYDSPYVIVSTSPERFVRVRGDEVLSQPIKGTRRAGSDALAAAAALKASPKEDRELSMIVDLIRNDIGARCVHGSVAVEGHKSIFLVDGLLQMYSNVQGRLRPGATCLDLLWDALPPGSVTGCPKKRAAEIIGRLEPHQRDVYCGCMALVWDENTMDSSVAIRTAVLDEERKRLAFFAGSGIVVDSDPFLEYQETLAKAEKFFTLINRHPAEAGEP